MIRFPIMAAAALFALSSCDNAVERDTAAAPTPMIENMELPESTLSALTTQQQLQRAGFDRDSFDNEYGSLRDELGSLPPRSGMDFNWLDRDDSDSLSVAEYALWAISDSSAAPNEEQIDGLTETYFYFDRNADGILSAEEFEAAVNSNLVV